MDARSRRWKVSVLREAFTHARRSFDAVNASFGVLAREDKHNDRNTVAIEFLRKPAARASDALELYMDRLDARIKELEDRGTERR